MRNKIKIFIRDNPYWLYELTISDIFNFNYIIKNFNNIEIIEYLFKNISNHSDEGLLFESITTCPFEVLLNLTISEFQEFVQSFIKQNHHFFNKKSSKTKTDQTKDNEFEVGLFDVCCHLIEHGHVNVMNYGYSFFFQAINNHEKIKSRDIAGIALATRMAQHSDDKQWKKYMRGLGVK